MNTFKRYSVLWFILITIALSFGTYLLPLPIEQKSLIVPVLMVLIPTVVSIPLVFLTEGREGIRQMISTASLRRGGLKWLLVGAGVGVMIRVVAWFIAVLLQMPVRTDLNDPAAWFLLLATIPLALFEETGWRSYALDRVLRTRSPLEAALLIGLPWGFLHLTILLPGMMSVGVHPIAQVGSVILLSVILTWAYVRSGHSLWTVTFLHGVQNGLVVLNRGLSIGPASWLLFASYFIFVIVLILFDRHVFFTKSSITQDQ
jgi:membrane protease YdiL (CAAX protease family)